MVHLEPAITWVKIEKPTFDLVGVVLGSFKLAGFLLGLAFALGIFLGTSLILSRRRPHRGPLDDVSLHLDTHAGR